MPVAPHCGQVRACSHNSVSPRRRAWRPGTPKASAGGRDALDADGRDVVLRDESGRCPGGEDDGCSRALRRRVTLISGGYRAEARQSTHDSAASGGCAICIRELGRASVSHLSIAGPHNRASDHPPSSQAVTDPAPYGSSLMDPIGRVLRFTSAMPRRVAALPTRNPRAHARSRRRSSVGACVPRSSCKTVDRAGGAPARRSQSPAVVGRGADARASRRSQCDAGNATPLPQAGGAPAGCRRA